MILDLDSIKQIILKNPNAAIISEAVKRYKKQRVHVTGEGTDDYLELIDGHENEAQRNLRRKLVRSNKGLFSYILRAVDKIFTAKGGYTNYNLPEKQKESFLEVLDDLWRGLSVRDYLRTQIFSKYIIDENGILFIEVGDNKIETTYKSILEIYDYKVLGDSIDYIIFNPIKDKDDSSTLYYRVVDDEFDRVVKTKKTQNSLIISIVEEETFKNHFGYVPAIVIGDISDPIRDMRTSAISIIIEEADEFLRDNSIRIAHKLTHGFSKYWEYKQNCLTCKGSGYVEAVDNTDLDAICPTCYGLGIKLKGNASDNILLDVPNDSDPHIIATNIAGYISPDIKIMELYNSDKEKLKAEMFEMMWGTTHTKSEDRNETATGRFLDEQPVNDKLGLFSKAFERLEKFIIDTYGVFYIKEGYQSYVSYGGRYGIETADQMMEKMTKALTTNAPFVIKANLRNQYLESEFINNSFELNKIQKLSEIEPFPFMSIKEVKELGVSGEEVKSKIYYPEFITQLTDVDTVFKTKEQLQKELITFIKTKDYEVQQTES